VLPFNRLSKRQLNISPITDIKRLYAFVKYMLYHKMTATLPSPITNPFFFFEIIFIIPIRQPFGGGSQKRGAKKSSLA